MPRSQLVLIALLVVLVIGGVGIFALSRPKTQVSIVLTTTTTQAQPSIVPSETSANRVPATLPVVQLSRTPTFTRTPIPTAQNTVIPSDSTFVPMPTRVLIQTRTGPTLTPSGPMINGDNQSIQGLQENFPPQLGGFEFVVEKDPWAVGGLGASYQYGSDQRIGIGISIGDGDGASSQLAEAAYRALFLRNEFKHPHSVDVGDEAIVDTQHAETIGLMRFRNAIVEVFIFSFSGQADPPISEETVVKILEDVEQYLEKESMQ